MGHRFNSATRQDGHCSLRTCRWSAFGLVRRLLMEEHSLPPTLVYPAKRVPRTKCIESAYDSTLRTNLKGVTRDEIEKAWGSDIGDSGDVDLLTTRPSPWFSTARVDGKWYDHVWAEGAFINDVDQRSMVFYTDHHHWSPLETDVLERLISALSGGWTIIYAHDGLAGVLSYMGIDDSRLCRYPAGIDWTSPSHTETELGCDPGHAVWISHTNQELHCSDFCYVYRWDALLGLLSRGPALISELSSAKTCPMPTHNRTVCGAAIDEAKRTVVIWPRSVHLHKAIERRWRGWSVECYPYVEGWSHHAAITGRPCGDQKVSWPDIVRHVLTPLNDLWSIETESPVDLDAMVQMQQDCVDELSRGDASHSAQDLERTGTRENSHFAHLLAMIELGRL